MGKKLIINSGDKYGKLVIIKEVERKFEKYRRFLCQCSCKDKTLIEVDLIRLTRGMTKSCGCLARELFVNTITKHGLRTHPIYNTWRNMKRRCYNKKDKDYKHYGGRGIKVCDEWFNSPKVFIEWCENNGYKEGLEIDRRDNDGNYEPSNCRFVTKVINSLNKRKGKDNKSGYRGVSINKESNKFVAIINHNNKQVFRKYGFKTAEAAAIARDQFIIDNNLPHPLNFTYLEPNLQSLNGWMNT